MPFGTDPRLVAQHITTLRAGGASYIKVDTQPAPATDRPKATMPVIDDVLTSTRDWLVAHDQPEEPAMAEARRMMAQQEEAA